MKLFYNPLRLDGSGGVGIAIFSFLILQSCVIVHVLASDVILENMFQKMSDDTRAFAKVMEDIYANRCTSGIVRQCKESNYAACASEFPMAACQSDPEWAIPACSANSCGAFFDFTTSSVRLADATEFTSTQRDANVKDDICYSQQAETYMKQKYEEDRTYWSQFGVQPPWYHYGADSGVFRIFPARPQDVCGSYDPRIRPWYVGASSGPKDVVLLLDTSGSMSQYGRLESMKEAANRVIGTLGLQDYVAVIEFDSRAKRVSLGSSFMDRATTANKEQLMDKVNNLKAGGGTDFIRGFQMAFDLLQSSVKQNEVSAGCHQTILFLTDGELNSDSGDEFDLYELIEAGRTNFAAGGRNLPVIFSYSFGSTADESVPKNIACLTNGIWSRINDGEDLAESMAGYYRYFAYGLGDETNEEFVSWTEPYIFTTGGHLGVTSSAPVYDRSVEPYLLVGVVGLDFTFAAMEQALGVQGSSGKETVLRRLSERSIAKCPQLLLAECDIQSLRGAGSASEEALCRNQCNDLSAVTPQVCDTSDHPNNVWANLNTIDRTFPQKACCTEGEIRTPGQVSLQEIKDQQCSAGSGASTLLLLSGDNNNYYFMIKVVLLWCTTTTALISGLLL